MTCILIAAVVVGLYMAWNIGANDVGNNVGTSVGSGALTFRQAIVLAGIFEFGGAFFVGNEVAETISKKIVDIEAIRSTAAVRAADPAAAPGPALQAPAADAAPGGALSAERAHLMVGMLCALLGAAVWVNVATFFSQPVSTTHAIIGAVIGFGLVAAGPTCVYWGNMGRIAASWVISPLAGGGLAFLVYRAVQKYVLRSRHPVFMARRAVPVCFSCVAFILCLSTLYSALKLNLTASQRWLCVPMAVVLAAVVGLAARAILRRRTAGQRTRLKDRYRVVEGWFSRIQPVTACYMCFAHGANDVANAIGPLAAVFHFAAGDLQGRAPVPLWLLALGGFGIVVGLATYGYKVIAAIGKKITEITPTRGFSAEFGTATTVLVCSLMGLPISTTLVLVGAVMGVGLARGFGAIDLRVIRRIFASWLITIPVSAVLTVILYVILIRLV